MAGLVFMLLYSTGLIGLLATGFTLRYWSHVLVDGQIWISLAYSLLLGSASLGASLALALALQAALGARCGRAHCAACCFADGDPPLVAALLSVQMLGNAGLLSRWPTQPD